MLSPKVRSSRKRKSGATGNRDVGALLEDRQGSRHQPAAGSGSGEGLFAQTLAIGRIGKEKIEGLQIADAAEIGRRRASACACGHAGRARRYSPRAGRGPRRCFRRIGHGGSRGGSFQANGAGTGKDVHHPRAIDGFGIGMAQYIEQALARAVRCRANVVRLRHRKRPTAKLTADDPHRASTPSALWAAPAGTAAIRATAARTTRRAASPTGLAREAACTARLSTRLAAKDFPPPGFLPKGLPAGLSPKERSPCGRSPKAYRHGADDRREDARNAARHRRTGARTLVALGAGPAVTTGTIAEWPIAAGLVTIRTITRAACRRRAGRRAADDPRLGDHREGVRSELPPWKDFARGRSPPSRREPRGRSPNGRSPRAGRSPYGRSPRGRSPRLDRPGSACGRNLSSSPRDLRGLLRSNGSIRHPPHRRD